MDAVARCFHKYLELLINRNYASTVDFLVVDSGTDDYFFAGLDDFDDFDFGSFDGFDGFQSFDIDTETSCFGLNLVVIQRLNC